ncbi:hypothetical protein QTH90_21445 [Variovorax sp. J2P1-59]|nr:hypothetical protein [Variovorax sp. J2P1-59]MDM0076989.1 hypothetical protein [Variovorax sp. J2P1-59]
MGPGNAKYDSDTARLLASMRKEPRKPMARAAARKTVAKKAKKIAGPR